MEEKNKKRFIKDLKVCGVFFWAAASLITAVHCWNMPEDIFITLCSLCSLAGALVFAVKECKELQK